MIGETYLFVCLRTIVLSGQNSMYNYHVYMLNVLLFSFRLLVTEKVGKACRDDSVEGLKFYPNFFLETPVE